MVPESGNCCGRLHILLLAAVFAAGCSSLGAMKHPVADTADGAGAGTVRQGAPVTAEARHRSAPVMTAEDGGQGNRQLSPPAGPVPLPRQEYDAKGARIPFVPQQNPYTKDMHPVPSGARAMFITANARLDAGDLASAQAKFGQLAKTYPKLSGAWVKLGEIAERRGHPDVAIGHYKRAISLNRNNVNAYIALGLAQRRAGQFGAAQHTYLAALKVWRDFPEAHLDLAILYDLYGNDAEEAQKHYEAYDFLTGHSDAQAHKWLAEVKQRTGIKDSFIDSPPVVVELVPADKAGDNRVAEVPAKP